jgi:hypothetical protein
MMLGREQRSEEAEGDRCVGDSDMQGEQQRSMLLYIQRVYLA